MNVNKLIILLFCFSTGINAQSDDCSFSDISNRIPLKVLLENTIEKGAIHDLIFIHENKYKIAQNCLDPEQLGYDSEFSLLDLYLLKEIDHIRSYILANKDYSRKLTIEQKDLLKIYDNNKVINYFFQNSLKDLRQLEKVEPHGLNTCSFRKNMFAMILCGINSGNSLVKKFEVLQNESSYFKEEVDFHFSFYHMLIDGNLSFTDLHEILPIEIYKTNIFSFFLFKNPVNFSSALETIHSHEKQARLMNAGIQFNNLLINEKLIKNDLFKSLNIERSFTLEEGLRTVKKHVLNSNEKYNQSKLIPTKAEKSTIKYDLDSINLDDYVDKIEKSYPLINLSLKRESLILNDLNSKNLLDIELKKRLENYILKIVKLPLGKNKSQEALKRFRMLKNLNTLTVLPLVNKLNEFNHNSRGLAMSILSSKSLLNNHLDLLIKEIESQSKLNQNNTELNSLLKCIIKKVHKSNNLENVSLEGKINNLIQITRN